MTAVVAAACIVAVLALQATVVARLLRDGRQASGAAPRRAPAHAPAHAAGHAAGGRGDGPIGGLRRKPWLRRTLSAASVAALLVAVGVVGYPFYTNLYADRVQARLSRQLASGELRDAYLACRAAGRAGDGCGIGDGDSLTRLRIPDIQVDVVVVEGVSDGALRAGAGHYPNTPLPCEPGNVGIAGHRTTYGRPFHDLDLLEPGDEIRLQVPIGECVYRVTETLIVHPSEVGVLAQTGEDRLTLTTCHPKGSARQRLVVTAELAEVRLTA